MQLQLDSWFILDGLEVQAVIYDILILNDDNMIIKLQWSGRSFWNTAVNVCVVHVDKCITGTLH